MDEGLASHVALVESLKKAIKVERSRVAEVEGARGKDVDEWKRRYTVLEDRVKDLEETMRLEEELHAVQVKDLQCVKEKELQSLHEKEATVLAERYLFGICIYLY
jgi:hypothetical protein